MLFQPRQPQFLSVFPSVIFTGSLLVVLKSNEPVCWWWDEDADLEMDRIITADAPRNHSWQPHHEKWNEKWFIAYSSSMLDCTWNIKIL